MTERPVLDKHLDSKTFRDFYYLKEESIDFCRENSLPTSGSKIEITDRIAHFLDTGETLSSGETKKRATVISNIYEDTRIESNFVCSEKHRAFFKEHIGNGFSFNVAFQKWLKSNAGKTYKEAIAAYDQIMKDKKKEQLLLISNSSTMPIFVIFADNKGKSLEEAIKCWNYKKQLQGHNRYERSDLTALD